MDRKEYMKDYMAKKRGVNKSVNKPPENVNKVGVVNKENVNKTVDVNKDVNKVILSDGQVWYPDLKIKKEAEKVFNDRVEYMGELRGDLEARKERVERYSKWRVGKGSMGNVEPLKVG